MFRATQAARVSVNQIMTEARRCQSGAIIGNSLSLTLASGATCTYHYSEHTASTRHWPRLQSR